MKLELRHLSGSRAGETESFDHATEITVGRHPSSLVLFDPDRDRSVSGHHASITFDGNRWMLRDHGSSNGTYVGDQRVREHELRSGETVQFGAQGPKVRVTFADEAMDSFAAAAPAEGRTVMMMIDQAPASAPAGAAVASMPRRKKGGMGRALLIAGTVGVLLLIGLAALALVFRNNNIKKRRQARAAQTTTTAATESASTTPVQTGTAGSESTTDEVALQQQIAETKENLESAQESIQKGDQSASEIADLRRQIAESQALMEQMTRQLQEKNDEVAAERARASAQPKVVYVPVPAPRSAAPQTEPSQPAASQPAPSQPTASQPAPAPAPVPQPAYSQPAVGQTVGQTAPPVRPAPSTARPAPAVVVETPVAPPPVRTTRPAPPIQKQTPPAQASGPAPLPPPPSPLYTSKALKMKVTIGSVPPEIPPANLPPGTEKGLVNLIGAALVSSGDYVVGSNGQANVSVMVTNYKADSNKNVNTAGTASSAKKIGKLFGQKLPGGNPVDVKNVSYDAAMSARVRILDRAGRILLETEPSSASADRKSKVAIGGVSFNDTALSDTAVGDVMRKVVADAVDALRVNLSGMDWTTQVGGSTKDKLTLAVGSSAFVEPGDVFEVLDAQQRVVARARVASVTETASEAMLITDPGKQRLAGLTARYIGNENPSATRRSVRTITTRAKTPVFSGPGTSFNQVRELKPGVRMNLHFTVGAWAKADDGTGAVWVPLANATIGS